MDVIETTQEAPSKVKFVHKKPEGYQKHYANGAYGAITPRGDFEFNFFFEHRDVPEEEVMIVEGNKLKPEEEDPTEVTITRDIKVGIIMTIGQAEALGNWLVSTVNKYREKQSNKEIDIDKD